MSRVLFVLLAVVVIISWVLSLIPINLPDTLRLVVNVIALVGGGISIWSTVEFLRDRFVPDKSRDRRPIHISTDPKDRIDGYLSGMLTRFEKEESVFVPLPLETRIQPKYSPVAEKRDFDSIDQALELYDSRFVLIGAPGAGKSTTLRSLMRQHIRLYCDNPITAPLPLWIDLGFSRNPVDAAELIAYWWAEQSYLPDTAERYLKQNRVILFLDGLNEMPEAGAGRKARADSLRTFLEKYPDLRVIVTCRVSEYKRMEVGRASLTTSYDRDRLDLGLSVVEAKPLDMPLIRKLLANHEVDNVLINRIESDPVLLQMVENPYMLTMVIIVAKGRRTLPASLTELYRWFVFDAYNRNVRRLMFGTDDPNKRPADCYLPNRASRRNSAINVQIRLEGKALEKRLRQLAYRMIAMEKGTTAPYQWAQRQIGARALRDGINIGVLQEPDGEIRYSHESLQGFFAVERLAKALRAKPFRIGRHDRYLFTPHPKLVIGQIRALGEIGAPAVGSLCTLVGNPKLDLNLRLEAIRALQDIGSSRAVEPLIASLHDSEDWVRNTIALALGFIGDARAIDSLLAALNDPFVLVRGSAALSLGLISDLRAVEPLITSLSDPEEWVRVRAIGSLGRIGDARAIEPLIACLSDLVLDVQNSATSALRKFDTPEAQEALAKYEKGE